MSTPTRWTNGFTQDSSTQPLGQVGVPDPFFYAYYEDDFLPYNSALYTATLDGGTLAQTVANGSGGRILLTTAAVAADFVGLQMTSAAFQIASGMKLAYLARVQVAAIASTSFKVGLIQTTVTPSTVTDGIYISFTAGGTSLTGSVVTGSTVIGSTTIAVAPVNATDIDLGFLVDRSGNVQFFAGHNLIGNKSAQYGTALLGPQGKILNTALTGSFTTALLNPTIEVVTTGPAETLVADFQFAAQER